ncbi:MAG: glutaminyl-peptide cyclotransferase [Rikenellaceae bacterium]
MKIKLFLMPLCLLAISCIGFGGAKTKSVANVVEATPPTYYSYKIEATYPHKTDSYTQGLIYHNGRLLEGTGQVGESRLLEVDLESGDTKLIAQLGGSHFGEGITILGDTLYQLTWITNRLFMYDASSGELLGEKIYRGEGWGITTDGEKLYMSDGSSVISVRDPKTFEVERRILVKVEGEAVEYLNELEWIDGKIWANVYTLSQIIIINPESGVVEGVVDLRGILNEEDITSTTDVLNGIAYDKEGGRIFVTGKNWNKLFQIKII